MIRTEARPDQVTPPDPHRARPRHPGVDALRGLGVALMVAHHFLWDLDHFGLYPLPLEAPAWQAFARSVGSLFLFTSGLALAVSSSRFSRGTGGYRIAWRRSARRGMILLLWAGVISAVTRLVVPEAWVRFGILHLLGVVKIIAPATLPLGRGNLGIGVALYGLGLALALLPGRLSMPWVLMVGPDGAGLVMVDHYPLLPWSGAVWLGMGVGAALVRARERSWDRSATERDRPRPRVESGKFLRMRDAMAWLGRHSLVIYLLHQPVLWGLLRGLAAR